MATIQNDRDITLQAATQRLLPITVNNNVELVGQQLRDGSVNTGQITPAAVSSIGYVQNYTQVSINAGEGLWKEIATVTVNGMDPNALCIVDIAAVLENFVQPAQQIYAELRVQTRINGVSAFYEFGVHVLPTGTSFPYIAKRLLPAPGDDTVIYSLQAKRQTAQPVWTAQVNIITVQQIKR